MIDTEVADRPVLLMDEGFHAAPANSAALEQLNITRDTADLVVLDKNLFESNAYEIHRTKVVMTVMDGEIAYRPAGPNP